MTSAEIVRNIIESKNGIAALSDLISAGVSRDQVYYLLIEGYIQRVSQGYYRLPTNEYFTEKQIIGLTIPDAVISMESALYYYGYCDYTPRVWSVTVPRTASRRIHETASVPLKVYYVKNELYALGKIVEEENGIPFSIYNRERTICDIIKHRNKIDREVYGKALNAYIKDKDRDFNTLSNYAKELRVYKKVTELMEVLMSG